MLKYAKCFKFLYINDLLHLVLLLTLVVYQFNRMVPGGFHSNKVVKISQSQQSQGYWIKFVKLKCIHLSELDYQIPCFASIVSLRKLLRKPLVRGTVMSSVFVFFFKQQAFIFSKSFSGKVINTALVLNTGECQCRIVFKASFNQLDIPPVGSAACEDINLPCHSAGGFIHMYEVVSLLWRDWN